MTFVFQTCSSGERGTVHDLHNVWTPPAPSIPGKEDEETPRAGHLLAGASFIHIHHQSAAYSRAFGDLPGRRRFQNLRYALELARYVLGDSNAESTHGEEKRGGCVHIIKILELGSAFLFNSVR